MQNLHLILQFIVHLHTFGAYHIELFSCKCHYFTPVSIKVHNQKLTFILQTKNIRQKDKNTLTAANYPKFQYDFNEQMLQKMSLSKLLLSGGSPWHTCLLPILAKLTETKQYGDTWPCIPCMTLLYLIRPPVASFVSPPCTPVPHSHVMPKLYRYQSTIH